MKRRFLHLFLAIVVFVGATDTATAAGASRNFRAKSDVRILNGEVIDGVERRADWVLSLRRNGRHICGASFIAPMFEENGKVSSWSSNATSPKWAVTAAHCVVEEDGGISDPGLFTVWGGVLNIAPGQDNPKGEIQHVNAIYIPTDSDEIGPYDPISLQNDIALLHLSDAEKELTALRRSIRLPTVREIGWSYDAYTAVATAGWGRTETGALSDALLEVRLPLVGRSHCQEKFDPFGDTIYPGMLCAGFASGEYDSCQGDSGGPLYYRPSIRQGRTAESVLLGVVSWGRGCGNSDLFGVYTRISYYEDWMRTTIEKHRSQ